MRNIFMSDIKTEFIQRCLRQYMEDVKETMRIAARRAGVGITDEAINSLASNVIQTSANLSFQNVLRFVDMGVGRGHPLGGIKLVTVELQSRKQSGLSQVKDKGRKAKKIYSKTAYGKLNYLENRLLHGYTEEAIAQIKQELENGTTVN